MKKNNETGAVRENAKGVISSFGSFLPAIALLAAGVLLAVWPTLSKDMLSICAGIVMTLYGIILTVLYFSRDVEIGIMRNSLMRGFLFIGLGIFVIARPAFLGNILPLVLGVLLIIGSAYKMQVAFDVWRMRDKNWYLFIVAGVVMLVLGIVILLNPFKTAALLMRVVGMALALEGLLDLTAIFRIRHTRKRYMADMVPLSTVVDVAQEDIIAVEETDAQPCAQDIAPQQEQAAAQQDTAEPEE